MELYKKVRPEHIDGLVGQAVAVSSLSMMLRTDSVPHALLFSGPSGTGKTTAARCLRAPLGCDPSEFNELNCADVRGIDTVREIRQHMTLMPMSGTSRMWVIDEAHRLTADAQNALLKMTEDTPPHVYFVLCSSQPAKIIAALRGRCTEVKFRSLQPGEVRALLDSVILSEGLVRPDGDVLDVIVEEAEGGARQALVMLEQVLTLSSVEEQISAVRGGPKAQIIGLCRELAKNPPKLGECLRIASQIDQEPEDVRRAVLGYFASIAFKGGPATANAARVIRAFECNYFDSGRAGLALSVVVSCVGT